MLRGDNADALTIPTAGAQGSVLTNIGLISGLQDFLGAGVTSFGSGNIIFGGDGSDIIEGRGGNDLIDGDLWLNVRISVRANADGTGAEIDSADSMVELIPQMLAGTVQPRPTPDRARDPECGGPASTPRATPGIRANYDRHHRLQRSDDCRTTAYRRRDAGVNGRRPSHQYGAAAVRRPVSRAERDQQRTRRPTISISDLHAGRVGRC